MKRIPILPPNGKDGQYIIHSKNTKGKKIGYPEGTQTHAYINPNYVTAIMPANNGEGCMIHLMASPVPLRCAVSADAANEVLF